MDGIVFHVGVKKICYGNGINVFGGLGFLTWLSWINPMVQGMYVK